MECLNHLEVFQFAYQYAIHFIFSVEDVAAMAMQRHDGTVETLHLYWVDHLSAYCPQERS